jgi:hypothetical protein
MKEAGESGEEAQIRWAQKPKSVCARELLVLLKVPRAIREACSVYRVPYIKIIKWEVITAVNVVYLFHCHVIVFQCNSKTHWCIFPTLAQVKNFVAIQIGLFHLQLFMNSHFPLLILVESVISQVLFQWPQQQGGWSWSSRSNDCNNSCVQLAWHIVWAGEVWHHYLHSSQEVEMAGCEWLWVPCHSLSSTMNF